MKIIKLTKGFNVIVDDEDFEYLNQFKWHANIKSNHVYATRGQRYGLRKNNKSKTIYMHRVILLAKDGEYVDHINLDTLNNCRNNLRICTKQQNSCNHRGAITQRKYSKYKGVKKNLYCKTWSARIMVNKKTIYLGSFRTEEEAALAYNNAAIKYFKNFAYLNEIYENHSN